MLFTNRDPYPYILNIEPEVDVLLNAEHAYQAWINLEKGFARCGWEGRRYKKIKRKNGT